jgi:hypothetical protein
VVTFALSDYLFISNKSKRVIGLWGMAMILSMLVFA